MQAIVSPFPRAFPHWTGFQSFVHISNHFVKTSIFSREGINAMVIFNQGSQAKISLPDYTVNIYRYKAIGANATSSVILYTGKCISPCLQLLQLLKVILQPLQDYLQKLKDFQTGANAFTGIQNYTGCCISPYSFVPINIYSVVWEKLYVKFGGL